MRYIGQKAIMNQLGLLLPHVYETREAISFLLRAPSGWGKTVMALRMCNYLAYRDFDYCIGDKVTLDMGRWVHFIDEVHLVKDPEFLYPLMDSGKHVFILATNDAALLKEALVNRCTELLFSPYEKDDLREIARTACPVELPTEFYDYVIESSAANPRIITKYMQKLSIVAYKDPTIFARMSLHGFRDLMKTLFGIVNGMDVLCQRYVETLKAAGGSASLKTLSTMLHVDENTLQFYAEPVLMYKNLIKISHKGRILCQ